MLEAYGAILNQRYDRFIREAGKAGFVDEISHLSANARRAWTVVFFGRPRDGVEILQGYQKDGRKLEDLIGDRSKAEKYDSVKRGLVNSAEAELLQKHLGI